MTIAKADFFKMLQQPLMLLNTSFHTMMAEQILTPQSNVVIQLPKYEDVQNAVAKSLSKETQINVAYYLNDEELPDNTVAYHPIQGVVSYHPSWWGFSTKEFMERIQIAEANPKIGAHFLHVNSPGGVAYGLDVASEIVKNAKKPVNAFVEGLACSAGYFLICNADEIDLSSKFDTIGSIGTMITLMDIEPYWEKLGIKTHEIYAEQSTLKNDTFNQAYKGKYKKIQERCLNPLAEDFINTVKSARKKATDEDIFKGETFFSIDAVENGLADSITPMAEVIKKAYEAGKKQSKRNSILDNY